MPFWSDTFSGHHLFWSFLTPFLVALYKGET